MKRSKLTAELTETLLALHRQLGMDAQVILEPPYNPPSGLNAALLKTWLSGRVKTARTEHLEYVLKAWGDLESMAPDHATTGGLARVTLTGKIRATLRAEAKRTGYAGQALVKRIKPRPAGLRHTILANWINGRTKTARRDHLQAVLDTYAALPDAPTLEPKTVLRRARSGPRLAFTQKRGDALRKERARTGVSAKKLCALSGEAAPPPGLHAGLINNWLSTDPDTVSKDDYEWALRAWKALSDKPKRPASRRSRATLGRPPKGGRRVFSKTERAELIAHRDRTGVMPTQLINELHAHDAPDGVSPGLITRWINNSPHTVRGDHLDWVLNAWKTLPDKN